MTPVTSFAGQKVALFGLGGSGLATAQALVLGGADVTAWDDNEAARAKASASGVRLADLRSEDWGEFAALVLAPGVPLTHPAPHWSAAKAIAAGVEVIGDIELFCRERAKLAPHAPFIAITGTNGKSTTTALTAHILRSAGMDVQLGGNIGTPILALEPPADHRFHVIECSSFQIDLAPSLNPTVGVLINLSPDHLDRHGTMENYADSKKRLVRQADVAFIGVDDPLCFAIGKELDGDSKGRAEKFVFPVSVRRDLRAGVWLDGTLIRSRTGADRILADLEGVKTLRGAHNAQNAAFATAAVSVWAFGDDVIQKGLSSFPGLAHRMEEVGRIDKAIFVNDSKATNADAAEKALLSFPDIYWILGGKPKEGGIEPLAPLFPKIRKAYLIGASAEDFARTLGDRVPHALCGTLEVAVTAAAADALESDAVEPVVLLSPACASYDQFPNFEVRGDAFRDLVKALVVKYQLT